MSCFTSTWHRTSQTDQPSSARIQEPRQHALIRSRVHGLAILRGRRALPNISGSASTALSLLHMSEIFWVSGVAYIHTSIWRSTNYYPLCLGQIQDLRPFHLTPTVGGLACLILMLDLPML